MITIRIMKATFPSSEPREKELTIVLANRGSGSEKKEWAGTVEGDRKDHQTQEAIAAMAANVARQALQ